MRLAILGLVVGAVATPALASDEAYRDARIRHAEAGVTVQSASEASAEEAVTNMPFLPGDRVWTDGGGRVEFQFADGSVLRLDSRSKLDYVAHDEGRGERIVLRLWAGQLHFQGAAEIEIETPSAYVSAREASSFRLDADAGQTRLSVYEGEADIEADRRRESVSAGERSWVSRGQAPEPARRFDTRENDDFAGWYGDRDDRRARSGSSESYLPASIDPYAGELENHGSWYFVAEVGQVWRPYVNAGWAPYTNGRWSWTAYGWTWIPYETWGWAPFHYGRWGYSGAVGWYWIPGSDWSPAWVSWAVGPDYVGWCALGRHDRPVTGGPAGLGHAVARGSGSTPSRVDTGAWNYARRGDLGAHDLARRRTTPPAEAVRTLHVAESARARPSRDLRVIDVDNGTRREAAPPRGGRLKPTPGDTVPELRNDPTTTIPGLVLRDPRPERYEQATPTAREGRAAREDESPRDVSTQRRSYERRSDEAADEPAPRAQPNAERERAGPGNGDRPAPAATPRARESEPDRDVLRRMFQPLSGPRRSEPRSSEPATSAPPTERRSQPRGEPRNAPPPRVERRSAPPPPPATQPRAVPHKDRDHP